MPELLIAHSALHCVNSATECGATTIRCYEAIAGVLVDIEKTTLKRKRLSLPQLTSAVSLRCLSISQFERF